MLKYFITFLLFSLGLIVAGVLAYSIAIFFCWIEFNEKAPFNLMPLLSSIAISSGVLIAILTYSRERKKVKIESERERSKYFLEEIEKGFNEALELLKHHTNNRALWVRAARSLLRTLELKNEVKSPECIVAYNLKEERVRNELYRTLSVFNEKTGEMESLPPCFFYGIENWRDEVSLDMAAIFASSDTPVYSMDINKVPPEATLTPLSGRTVIAIFDFMEYPDDYNDPLKTIKPWTEDWQDSFGISRGARRYIAHTKEKQAVGGKLFDIGGKGKS